MPVANSKAERAEVITDLIIALWRVILMSGLNLSLSNKEYTIVNVLKALPSMISACNLHIILLWKIIPLIFK